MSLITSFIPIATDSEGRTVPNALLYSYETGTNTPKVTYSNVDLTIPNANPLESDGSGKFFDVFVGSGGYRLVVTNQFNEVLWWQDDYYPSLDTADLAIIEAEIAAVQQQISQSQSVYTDSGTADNYVLTIANNAEPPDEYGNAMIIYFSVNNANTGGPAFVDVEGLGNVALKMPDNTDPPANFLVPGVFYGFINVFGLFFFFFKSGLVTTPLIQDGAVTTDKIEDIAVTTAKINANAVTPAKMSDGTLYKLTGYGSDNAFTEYTNAIRLLTSGAFSSAASLPFVLSSLDTSQAVNNTYLLRIVGMQPASDDKELYLTLSTDGGSTYVATNYVFSSSGGLSSGGSITNSGTANQATILGGSGATEGLSNVSGEIASIDIYITQCNTGTSLRPMITGAGSFWAAAAATLARQSFSASNTAAGDYDAIKLTLESGGNFAVVGQYYLFKFENTI